MADDDLTHGEIARTFRRQDEALRATNDRLSDLARETVPAKLYETAHQALIDRVIHVEQELGNAVARLESAAAERHRALGRDIDGLRTLVEREIEDVRDEIKGINEQKRQDRDQSSSRLIAWIAALAAVALVVVTLIQSGGH